MGEFLLNDLDALPAAAEFILQEIRKDNLKTVAFFGEMGAGKTTLIREICLHLGSKDVVTSPTFSLINEYHIPEGFVYHFDFYRIEKESEILNIGAEEYFYSDNLCLVEWPEKAVHLFPDKFLNVYIRITENNTRILSTSVL